MIVYINNIAIKASQDVNIAELLENHGGLKHMAVWLNGELVILEEYNKTVLKLNDRLKVVKIHGGG